MTTSSRPWFTDFQNTMCMFYCPLYVQNHQPVPHWLMILFARFHNVHAHTTSLPTYCGHIMYNTVTPCTQYEKHTKLVAVKVSRSMQHACNTPLDNTVHICLSQSTFECGVQTKVAGRGVGSHSIWGGVTGMYPFHRHICHCPLSSWLHQNVQSGTKQNVHWKLLVRVSRAAYFRGRSYLSSTAIRRKWGFFVFVFVLPLEIHYKRNLWAKECWMGWLIPYFSHAILASP